MKKVKFWLAFLLLLLFLPKVSAEFSETTMLSSGQTAKVGGKTVLLEKVNEHGQVVVKVDGVGGIISEYGQIKIINGATITLGDINYINDEIATASLTILVKHECGNNICDLTENIEVCCTDCGCLESKNCFENQCIIPEQDECLVDKDCNDGDESTLDTCEKGEIQRICKNSNIPKHECFIDRDCNENKPCTIDICLLGEINTCAHTEITKCSPFDSCCPLDCSYFTDSDCEKTCINDLDCDDHNPCTTNRCANQKCVIDEVQGCALKNECLPQKIRKKIEGVHSYCEKTWLTQKKENSVCNEDYECKSNECTDQKCEPQGFLAMLFSFIRVIL